MKQKESEQGRGCQDNGFCCILNITIHIWVFRLKKDDRLLFYSIEAAERTMPGKEAEASELVS